MQLVHSETELVEVDVDIDQQVRGQGRGEHTLEDGVEVGGRQASEIKAGQGEAPPKPPGGISALII